ncbi:MAG: MFS transporter [Lachnospiraceae bacterium]
MKKKRFLSNIIILGFVSLFADMSTEMVYPIVPLYLTTALGAAPALIGLMEGISESIASLLKVFGGYIGDRDQNKKKLAFIGYSGTVIYKILLLISTSWTGVLIARVMDRTGKGIRTAPRDALIAQSSDSNHLGKSFGIHKMLDMVGASFGALLAYFIVASNIGFHRAFLLSIIPAIAGLFTLSAVREENDISTKRKTLSWKGFRLNRKLTAYLIIIFIFCLGNSSNAFILLKAREQGFSSSQVMLLYFIFNMTASIFSIPAGRLSDQFGRSRILVPGYLLYGLVYLGFAYTTSKPFTLLLFISYGIYTASISGAERAFISENSPLGFTGTVLGLYSMMQGFGLLLSSLIAGLLWEIGGSDTPFLFGGLVSSCAAFLILLLLRKK